jgi:hypothetical protein
MGLRAGQPRFFTSPQRPDRLWGPPSVKRQGCEADHSPPSSAEFKNGGAILPRPISLQGIMLK